MKKESGNKYLIRDEEDLILYTDEAKEYLGIKTQTTLNRIAERGFAYKDNRKVRVYKAEKQYKFYLDGELDYQGPLDEASEDLEITKQNIIDASSGWINSTHGWTVEKCYVITEITDSDGNPLEI